MNPTFSSPVLTERCTYRWEDLEKAAQGIFTDELRAEQKRLSSDYATAHVGEAVSEFESLDALTATESVKAAPVAGFSVPNRDEAGFLVKTANPEKPHRTFFEPPRVTIPTRSEPMTAAAVTPQSAVTEADLERVAEATAQAVTENLLGQIDGLVAAVLTEAAGKVKTEMAAAVNEAVARGIREGLEKARRHA